MAAGVATLVLGVGAYDSLATTRERYYEANRFADVFATLNDWKTFSSSKDTVLCGKIDSSHFDGDITVDVDSYLVTLATDADVLVRMKGPGAEAISSRATRVATRSGQLGASSRACFSAGSNGHIIARALTRDSGGADTTLFQSAFRSRRDR